MASGYNSYGVDTIAPPAPASPTAESNLFPLNVGGVVSWYYSDQTGATTALVGVPPARTISTGTGLTGGGDLTANRTISMANMGGATVKGRALAAGAGAPTDLSQTEITALINEATQVLSGALGANDKKKLDSLWIDVTANPVAVIAPTNGAYNATTAAANVTAWNTLYAAAPVGATFYFPSQPAGTYYDFSNELACNRDIRMAVTGAGPGRSILRQGTNVNTTANLFNQSVAGYYIDFESLGFTASGTKTGGAAIAASSNNAYLNVHNCEFTNQYRGLDLSGTAGNVGLISKCWFGSPAPGGSQIRVNGANINMMFTNITLNCTGVNADGFEVNASGAIQVVNSDFIGGRNTLLVNATGVVSALYFTNCFFDQATLGSTVKFTGSSATSRVKFVQCGITNGGGSGLVACEIAGTGSGTGIPEGIDFLECDFYNNGFAGTSTGMLVTGCRGFDMTGCRVAGFTTGVDISPYSANGVTNFNIQGCTIGPTENFNGNGTGIRVNAGAFTYGSSSITDNDLSGNTTAPLVQNGNFAGTLIVQGNQGLPNGTLSLAPQVVPTTATYIGGLSVPPNSLTTKTHFRVTMLFRNTAATASNTTVRLKWGTAASIADSNIMASVYTGTLAAGFAKIVVEVSVTVLSATVGEIQCHSITNNGANAATGFSSTALGISNTVTSTLNTTTAANFLGVELLQSVASVHSLVHGNIEVVSQGF